MKTTIEIPDPLYREAKIRAVETGQTLKHLVLTALERELRASVAEKPQGDYWSQRKLRPGYKAALEEGAFTGGTDSTDAISEDRDTRDGSVL
ncbi:MAG: hypothetical protein ACP5I4_05430 [Oceanipulchritudo sp.]